jgi:hypothetical protein
MTSCGLRNSGGPSSRTRSGVVTSWTDMVVILLRCVTSVNKSWKSVTVTSGCGLVEAARYPIEIKPSYRGDVHVSDILETCHSTDRALET